MNPERASRAVAVTSMFASAALSAAKITVGLHANSTAVVSDGLESAGDVLASGLALVGLVLAAKPADSDHPYGHGRGEILSALIVGMMLTASGALISFRSLERVREIQQAPAAYAVWPLIASIVIKSIMSLWKRRLGRKIGSSALLADAWNDTVDILSGSTALVALGITLYDPVKFVAADHLGGAAVGVIVIFLGVRVVRDTTLQLMDTMPDPAALDQIRQVALRVPGALAIEKCYARKTGLQWHVDLHLEVDPVMSVFESHEIATQVRIRVREELDWVADVLVHVEPHLMATISSGTHGKS
ncbi:MAG TPA: cation diffusion facilitator family transporter [Bryobacteraceae bacterium]|jgi:cation diffusion facilitator family transporter|nr:cation diffusion facilitator family transporter [Bryobacteraceae bacterium]